MEQDVEQPELIEEKHTTILRVENVSKTYSIPDRRLQVLQNVHLQVHHGEFIAITGSSGSGKTTLLSLLGALDSPDSGEIWLDELAVHRLRGIEAADRLRLPTLLPVTQPYCLRKRDGPIAALSSQIAF